MTRREAHYQAETARRHIGADLVVVVHKRRGKPDVDQAFFTMPADSWVRLMTEAGRLP